MKILKSLLGKKKEDETPTWDITPEADRPAPKKRRIEEEPLPRADEERNRTRFWMPRWTPSSLKPFPRRKTTPTRAIAGKWTRKATRAK
jgi:hypothetical protein